MSRLIPPSPIQTVDDLRRILADLPDEAILIRNDEGWHELAVEGIEIGLIHLHADKPLAGGDEVCWHAFGEIAEECLYGDPHTSGERIALRFH